MVLKLLFQGSGSGPVPNRAVVETSSGAQGLSPNSAQHLWVQTPECLTLNTRTWKLSPQARLLEVNVTSLSYRATKGPWAPTILSVYGFFKPPWEAPSAFGNDESGTCVRRVDGCCGLAQKRTAAGPKSFKPHDPEPYHRLAGWAFCLSRLQSAKPKFPKRLEPETVKPAATSHRFFASSGCRCPDSSFSLWDRSLRVRRCIFCPPGGSLDQEFGALLLGQRKVEIWKGSSRILPVLVGLPGCGMLMDLYPSQDGVCLPCAPGKARLLWRAPPPTESKPWQSNSGLTVGFYCADEEAPLA